MLERFGCPRKTDWQKNLALAKKFFFFSCFVLQPVWVSWSQQVETRVDFKPGTRKAESRKLESNRERLDGLRVDRRGFWTVTEVFGQIHVTFPRLFLANCWTAPASVALIYDQTHKCLTGKQRLSCAHIGCLSDDLGCQQAVNKEEVSWAEWPVLVPENRLFSLCSARSGKLIW